MFYQIVVGSCITNCYLFVNDRKECVVIDPGGDEVEIISIIKELGITPLGIVLTHGHVDHTAAAGKVADYFRKKGQKVPVALHRDDDKYLGESGDEVNKNFLEVLGPVTQTRLTAKYSQMAGADLFIREMDKVFGMNVQVIETPGHSKGSICLYAEEENLLFSGDTLFFQGTGRTDFPDSSQKSIVDSIKSKLFSLPPDTQVLPGHGPTTTIGMEKDLFA